LTIRRYLFLAAAVALGALALSSCGGGTNKPLTKVFLAAPWSGGESLQYDLVLQDGKIYGHCLLEVVPNADSTALTRLNRTCGDGQNHDDGSVLVDPKSLQPTSAHREVVQADKNDRWTYDTAYNPPKVTFTANTNGNIHTADRELAKPTKDSPDPGYYDDESLLWLVRGVDLRDGYEGSYQNVNASTGRVFTVDLKVGAPEQVKVKGGEFSAWKVRIRTSSVTNTVWVETAAPHRVIKARFAGLEDVSYEFAGNGNQ
jgi:hypothetical protein